ncbi:MAG: hypothetical protein AAF828_03830 [Bacteroidota bacterium]
MAILTFGCYTSVNDAESYEEVAKEQPNAIDTFELIKPPNIVYDDLIPEQYSQRLGKTDLYTTNGHDTTDAANRTRLRNLGFCDCLNTIYPDFEDTYADGSAGGFFMLSKYGPEIIHLSKLLARDFIDKRGRYESFDPAINLGLMQCLDYYNSRELDHFIDHWQEYQLENWEE